MASQFPISKTTTFELQQLTKVLWSWFICAECLAGQPCQTETCSWPRSAVIARFIESYKMLTAQYESDVRPGQDPGLRSHEDLRKIIEELKSDPYVTRQTLLESLFPDRPARSDQERAVNMAVRVLLMINCASSRQSPLLLEHGSDQTPWRSEVPFSEFITSIFPRSEHPSIDDIKQCLRATKLNKRAGLRFEATDDLKNHLKLDRKRAVVQIFHHTSFLKEQLRLTKDVMDPMSVTQSIKLSVK